MYRIYLISQDADLDHHMRAVVSKAAEMRWEGAYARFSDLFEHVLDANPAQIILVDAHFLPPEELRAICRFRASHPATRFIPLLRSEIAELVQLTGTNGKGPGIDRRADARTLLDAIGSAGMGAAEAGTSTQSEAGTLGALQPALRHQRLTRREMEVLQRLSMGEAQKQIAERLGLSPHTVDNHVRSIFRKLQARSAVDAVAKGFRRGILN